MKFLIPVLAVFALSGTTVIPQNDVVLRAMNDELHRTMQRLHLDPYKGPYFVSYSIQETDNFSTSASFGAQDNCVHTRKRELFVDVREGDYSLDSSNAAENSSSIFARMANPHVGTAITIDNDYDSIRHQIWLRTDEAYKKAIEDLASKKAFLQENKVKEKPDSMSHEKPIVTIEPLAHLELDQQKAKELACKLSAIFREYPRVQKSQLSLGQEAVTRWFVNSEGSCDRIPRQDCMIMAQASGQADDDKVISDAETITSETTGELPPYPEMEKTVRGLAERITKLATAKTVEQYSGPILLEHDAAAEFFSQVLQPNLGHAPETLSKDSQLMPLSKNVLAERLNTRILPAFISVVDDPLSNHFGNTKLVTSFTIDDEGVQAQKITLVDKGILKTFAMSRSPSREIKQSNGHAEGNGGVASNVYILASTKLTPAQLRQRLITLGKEDGLKEVLIARRLTNFSSAALNPKSLIAQFMAGATSEVKLLPPALLYLVSTQDGHEELVRGSQFGNLSMRVLRDIDAVGDDARAYPVLSLADALHSRGSTDLNTIVTPSVLIREVELQQTSHQTELPPILKNPYFEKQ